MVPQLRVMDPAESCGKNYEETIDVAVVGENGCSRKGGKVFSGNERLNAKASESLANKQETLALNIAIIVC